MGHERWDGQHPGSPEPAGIPEDCPIRDDCPYLRGPRVAALGGLVGEECAGIAAKRLPQPGGALPN